MVSLLAFASLAFATSQADTTARSSTVAIYATQPPIIDGRDNDPVWRQAPPITEFTQWQPTEGKAPRFKTDAKVAYDAANLYVFVRSFDPHPDSIIKLLERRDSFTPSDMIWLFLDPYHDKRTGYEFGVNAAGVKLDAQISNGGNEDFAWDAVWDVATTVDSLGWSAEFRIPLSQLRYGKGRSHTFGFTIDRDIYRYNERVSWPAFSQSKPDMLSQLGTLDGLENLEVPRRLEAMPYVVSKRASTIVHNQFTNPNSVSVGGDVKYRVASNMTWTRRSIPTSARSSPIRRSSTSLHTRASSTSVVRSSSPDADSSSSASTARTSTAGGKASTIVGALAGRRSWPAPTATLSRRRRR
jgi:hypothetical protein